MKIILLSGGSGKRLWPLSNDARSKQFLKVLKDKQENNISMLQKVWDQLKTVGLTEDCIIATSSSQVNMIRKQIGNNVNIVVEPHRRDTYPAIALACSYLATSMKCTPDENVIVLPVDPYVDDQFFHSVKELDKTLNYSNADVALLGVKPTFPSEKYGYILPNNYKVNSDYYNVERFVEKPDEKLASKLINKKALWNCGVFAFKLDYILKQLSEEEHGYDYHSIISNYDLLEKTSFDYKILEKANSIVAQEYKGYWKDLGTWNTLSEEIEDNIVGLGRIDENIKGSHVVNELGIPIILIGIDNAIVAASPDGILVSSKNDSPKIKKYLDKVDSRPMFEEDLWGTYTVLDYCGKGNIESLTKKININKDYILSFSNEDIFTTSLNVVSGRAILQINDHAVTLEVGDVYKISENEEYAIEAIEDLTLIATQRGIKIEDEVKVLKFAQPNTVL